VLQNTPLPAITIFMPQSETDFIGYNPLLKNSIAAKFIFDKKNLPVAVELRTKDGKVDLRGKLDKVTIIFKPLGLNHFINNPIKEIVGQPSSIFAEWDGDKYAGFLNAFYRTNVNRKRIVLLEEFLLSRYKTFAEATVLKEVLNHLTDFENERSVEEIARVVNLNVRTLNRLFGKHLGISPITFRKIARFRHAMKNRIYGERLKTLTEIGYESNFYDQSYFIKMYQKLTGNNPSKFFRSIEKLSDDRLVFSFIKK
jgi:AraC-like DNA-binding protein